MKPAVVCQVSQASLAGKVYTWPEMTTAIKPTMLNPKPIIFLEAFSGIFHQR